MCAQISGCRCVGPDCENGYDSLEACERLNRSCIEGCAAQDAMGEGLCDAEIGTFWNGSERVIRSGCGCAGAGCDQKYTDVARCMEARRACSGCKEKKD